MTAFLTLLTLAGCTFVGKSVAEIIKDSNDVESWLDIWWRGAAVSLALATLGALTLGSPSCEEQTERGCITYADDGFEATTEDRVDSGLQVLWKTVLGGTAGLLLLKREEEEKARIEGRPVFAEPVKVTAGILSADPERFAKAVEVYALGAVSGFGESGSQYSSDFKRTGRTLTLAVELINQRPAEERAVYAEAFNKVKANSVPYIHPTSENIFRSGVEVKA